MRGYRFSRRFLYIITVGLVGLTSCKVNEPSAPTTYELIEEIAFEEVHRDALMGGGNEGIEFGLQVVRSEEEWDQLLAKMGTENPVDEALSSQVINFKKEVVLFLFDNLRGTGGYDFGVYTIQEYKDDVLVTFKIKAPEGPAPEVLTQQYHVVKMPKTSKPIVLGAIR